MVSTFIGLLDIQSWWEIPCISHFCSLFSSAFDLPDIDIEDLESALLSDGTSDEDQVALVPELIVRLLKGCDALQSVAKEITHSNYQMFLRRFLRQQCRLHQTENHFDTDIDFQSLPVRKRLHILHDLCHFRLDSADVQVILSNLEADSLRVEPLGYDAKNSGYWYFYGTRLYREDKAAAASSSSSSSSGSGGDGSASSGGISNTKGVGSNGTVWQVICFTEEDWQNLAAKFKTSTNAKERELFHILDDNFLPKLPQLFRERERLRRRKSQSTSTASGISTYASSLRRTTTTNSSEFLCHRETFCLSPENDEDDDDEALEAEQHPNQPEQTEQQPREEEQQQEPEELLAASATGDDFRSPETPKSQTPAELKSKSGHHHHHHHHHHKKKKSGKKQKKRHHRDRDRERDREHHHHHRRRHKYASEADEGEDDNNNHNSNSNSNSNTNSTSSNNSAQPKRRRSGHQQHQPEPREPTTSLSPEDKENFCRQLQLLDTNSAAIAVATSIADLSLPSPVAHESETEQDEQVDQPAAAEPEPPAIAHSMAPAANVKLPGRQTNNSLSSLTGNIFIPGGSAQQQQQQHQQQQSQQHQSQEPQSSSSSSHSATSASTVRSKKQKAVLNSSGSSSSSKVADKADRNLSKAEAGKSKKSTAGSSASSSSSKAERNSGAYSDKSGDDFTETEEVLQIGMHKVLVYVKNHRDAWPFVDPVEEDIAPRYYSIIRRPMDLLKMEDKLDSGEYHKFSEFRNDFRLIVNNCRLYNGHNNEYTEMVNNLQDAFEKATKKYFENLSDDEDDDPNLSYPAADSKMNVFREKYFSKKSKDETEKDAPGRLESSAEEDISEVEAEAAQKAQKRKRKEKDKRRKKKTKSKADLETDDEDMEPERIPTPPPLPPPPSGKKSKTGKRGRKTKGEKSASKPSKQQQKTKKGAKKSALESDPESDPSNSRESEDYSDDDQISLAKAKSLIKPTARTIAAQKKKVVPAESKVKMPTPVKRQVKGKGKGGRKVKDDSLDSEQSDLDVKKQMPPTAAAALAESAAELEDDEDDQPADEDEDEDGSRSRSMSPFKVDLHKKYSKSALNDDLSELLTTVKKVPTAETTKLSARHQDEADNDGERSSRESDGDFKSLSSSRASSEERPPVPKKGKKGENSKKEKEKKSRDKEKDRDKDKDKDKSRSAKHKKSKDESPLSAAAAAAAAEQAELEMLLPFMDKYDVIKYRRSRAALSGSSASNSLAPSEDSKPASTKSNRESKKATAKREKSPDPVEHKRGRKSKDQKRSKESDKHLPPAPSKVKEAPAKTAAKKRPDKQMPPPPKPADKPSEKGSALDVETEQTLKDINRWLEHTPRFTEFSSASNSPSRYNLLDDFDSGIGSKLDAADFRRPVALAAPKAELVPTKLAEALNELVSEPKVAASKSESESVAPTPSSVSSSCGTPPHSMHSGNSIGSTSATAASSSNCSNNSMPTPLPVAVTPTPTPAPPPLLPIPKPKEPSTTQLLLNPPPPPHIKQQLAKEAKRKSLKEKQAAQAAQAQQVKAKANVMRTIERLQPGKAKGNLLQNVATGKPTEETGDSHAGVNPVATKVKELKNALITETCEGAPKLSLGTVLKTQDFALGKSLGEMSGKKVTDEDDSPNEESKSEKPSTPTTPNKEAPKPFEALLELSKIGKSSEGAKAEASQKEKPNLSAWLKAFGGPKVSKKSEEEEKQQTSAQDHQGDAKVAPPAHSPAGDNFSLPTVMRQRKPSTGSTNSERSSFSQDPDSPRIAIDERYGSYAAGSYTSPIASPYPLNGAIKVGFYQDTTTKSSPDKSCSPREMNSPYPQYSQHIYSSASSPNVSTPDMSGTSPYGGGNSYNPSGSEASKTPAYSSTSPLPIYDQYKQPRSQESDYNSSMSPSTPNPHSPYQQPQSSPYTTPQQSQSTHPSPYHGQSPYHQQQHSPYHPPATQQQQQSSQPSHSPAAHQQALSPMHSVESPASSAATQPPTPLAQSPAEQQHSPYQQPVLSPYQQPQQQVQPPVVPPVQPATSAVPSAALSNNGYAPTHDSYQQLQQQQRSFSNMMHLPSTAHQHHLSQTHHLAAYNKPTPPPPQTYSNPLMQSMLGYAGNYFDKTMPPAAHMYSASRVSSPVGSTAATPATSGTTSNQTAADAAAISLKTSTGGMVPGSAFNFAPAPGALGLYGDQAAAASSYLDQFRDAPNPYYMPPAPAHSGATANPGGNAADKSQNPLNTAAGSYPFLAAAHPSSRAAAAAAAYPFADPNSQLYQQYLRRDDFHTRMIFNQSLLGGPAAAAAAAGYGQPPPPPSAYQRATLGMPKPYDINRQSWF
ncbi:hypothetical protein M5D96_006498 [Drosophila gunungcola]|uniref:Bromo domain-containing protein n=1 Tax=Drosophila gunungcola TaxID=103775 RepID=A0A9P9YP26_9MUSC|nr:hypothetical protein M5D96_006498 [Drosophila gunungcola]